MVIAWKFVIKYQYNVFANVILQNKSPYALNDNCNIIYFLQSM